MRHVLKENPARFKQLAVRVFDIDETGRSDEEIALEGISKLSDFWTSLGAPNRLADYDISDEKLDTIAGKAMANGAFGQFKSLQKEDVLAILKASL